ncbi:MAG: NAD(P)/FAD-dependent oxidoreductase [Pelagibacterium sp.]|uniref:NAD(P)/FAD-dependent oxidoreductase n=1 Tax=Pelagibacterium sp. TaxID=1967288 RepID=UPI0032EFC4F8
MTYDVIIIGGSYAGMSAAFPLIRARRTVLIIDGGKRRNRFASHSHGFLTQDGVAPDVIAAQAGVQLSAYPTLTWVEGNAASAVKTDEGFAVTLEDGQDYTAKRLILAHGVTDTLPEIAGIEERWGKSVFHCPYCHGYELEQGRIGVIGVGPMSMHHALMLPDWGQTTFLPNDTFEPDADQLVQLAARGAALETGKIEEIAGRADVRLADGRVLSFDGLFVASIVAPSSPIAEQLGCAIEQLANGRQIVTDEMKQTSVPYVFACGDAARAAGSVPLAVGDGTMAGGACHRTLMFG